MSCYFVRRKSSVIHRDFARDLELDLLLVTHSSPIYLLILLSLVYLFSLVYTKDIDYTYRQRFISSRVDIFNYISVCIQYFVGLKFTWTMLHMYILLGISDIG
jgi:hypothetical protein